MVPLSQSMRDHIDYKLLAELALQGNVEDVVCKVFGNFFSDHSRVVQEN